MLVITRKCQEEIVLAGDFGEIRVRVVRIQGKIVRLGIAAGPEVNIRRAELPILANSAEDGGPATL